jgi:2EXR family
MELQDTVTSPKMEPPTAMSPNINQISRLQYLLSILPKLIIPTPLQPLETFTLFSQLPIEIRTKVWKLLSFQPRKVKLFFDRPPVILNKRRSIDGQSRIPVVLRICQESRKEGLRHYTLCKEKVPIRLPVGDWINHLYINFNVDHFMHGFVLEYGEGFLSSNFDLEVLEKIRFIDAHYDAHYSMATRQTHLNDFQSLALDMHCVRAANLKVIRLLVTPDTYTKLLRASRPPRESFRGNYDTHCFLQDIVLNSTKSRVHSTATSILNAVGASELYWGYYKRDGWMIPRLRALYTGGITDCAIWDYDLGQLDSLPYEETEMKV